MAGKELSGSTDIFFEAETQKSSLFLGKLPATGLDLHAHHFSWLGYMLLHCKSFGSDILFNIASVFTQT